MQERIKKLRKAVGLTQQAFADRLGLKQNTVASYEMGRSGLSDVTITAIVREFNANETWLRTGEGEMFLPKSMDDSLSDFFGQVLADKPEAFRRRLAVAMSKLSLKQWQDLADIAETLLSNYQEDK